jgi:Xaa-Pro aminopeptidase
MFGHSIGLYVHEPPIIDAKTARSLEPGMVLCVEHGWTDTEYPERYHIEDMILVTDNSAQILSNTTSIDDMLVIA